MVTGCDNIKLNIFNQTLFIIFVTQLSEFILQDRHGNRVIHHSALADEAGVIEILVRAGKKNNKNFIHDIKSK